MRKIIFMASLLGAVLVGQVASAQTIGERQQNQRQRIRQGMQQGDLTRQEGTRLKMQQARIQGNRQMAMADGRFTPRERGFIRGQQRRAGYNIYNSRHNNRFGRHHGYNDGSKGWGHRSRHKYHGDWGRHDRGGRRNHGGGNGGYGHGNGGYGRG